MLELKPVQAYSPESYIFKTKTASNSSDNTAYQEQYSGGKLTDATYTKYADNSGGPFAGGIRTKDSGGNENNAWSQGFSLEGKWKDNKTIRVAIKRYTKEADTCKLKCALYQWKDKDTETTNMINALSTSLSNLSTSSFLSFPDTTNYSDISIFSKEQEFGTIANESHDFDLTISSNSDKTQYAIIVGYTYYNGINHCPFYLITNNLKLLNFYKTKRYPWTKSNGNYDSWKILNDAWVLRIEKATQLWNIYLDPSSEQNILYPNDKNALSLTINGNDQKNSYTTLTKDGQQKIGFKSKRFIGETLYVDIPDIGTITKNANISINNIASYTTTNHPTSFIFSGDNFSIFFSRLMVQGNQAFSLKLYADEKKETELASFLLGFVTDYSGIDFYIKQVDIVEDTSKPIFTQNTITCTCHIQSECPLISDIVTVQSDSLTSIKIDDDDLEQDSEDSSYYRLKFTAIPTSQPFIIYVINNTTKQRTDYKVTLPSAWTYPSISSCNIMNIGIDEKGDGSLKYRYILGNKVTNATISLSIDDKKYSYNSTDNVWTYNNEVGNTTNNVATDATIDTLYFTIPEFSNLKSYDIIITLITYEPDNDKVKENTVTSSQIYEETPIYAFNDAIFNINATLYNNDAPYIDYQRIPTSHLTDEPSTSSDPLKIKSDSGLSDWHIIKYSNGIMIAWIKRILLGGSSFQDSENSWRTVWGIIVHNTGIAQSHQRITQRIPDGFIEIFNIIPTIVPQYNDDDWDGFEVKDADKTVENVAVVTPFITHITYNENNIPLSFQWGAYVLKPYRDNVTGIEPNGAFVTFQIAGRWK